jgi:protein-S-isoprenylcysteine O-methyltransferase Ste14
MISNLSLIIFLAIATHLIRLCNRTPNVPETKHDKDSLFSVPLIKNYGPQLLEYAFLLPCIHHIIITAMFHELNGSAICPHPEHLDRKYFVWSNYTIISLATIFISAALRLFAFRTLGKNFTFELAKPDQLVTSGVYAYLQHPSYSPLFILLGATLMLFLPLDATPGCFLPWTIVEIWITWRWHLLALAMAIIALGLGVRVRDEEAMLKETFGKQWIEWHRRTARFVPFLF